MPKNWNINITGSGKEISTKFNTTPGVSVKEISQGLAIASATHIMQMAQQASDSIPDEDSRDDIRKRIILDMSETFLREFLTSVEMNLNILDQTGKMDPEDRDFDIDFTKEPGEHVNASVDLNGTIEWMFRHLGLSLEALSRSQGERRSDLLFILLMSMLKINNQTKGHTTIRIDSSELEKQLKQFLKEKEGDDGGTEIDRRTGTDQGRPDDGTEQ